MPHPPTGTVAPTIETARLRLRSYRIDDIDARAALFADAEHLRHVGGGQTREECWIRIQRYVGHWALLGYGPWAVEEQASGRLIGEVGLGRFERSLGADFDDAPEGAWIIGPGHAPGYATEAMRTAVGWYEAAFGPARMVAVIAHENAASLRVAEKLGFAAFAERDYKGGGRLLLERPATTKRVTPPSAIG